MQEAKALAHPLRRRMLSALRGRRLSGQQLAGVLDEPATKLYHHLKVLEQAGLIEAAGEARRRGATERFYTTSAAAFLAPRLAPEDGPHEIFLSALAAGHREVDGRLDVERIAAADEDLYLSACTEVRADDAALRELSEFLVDWIGRRRARPAAGAGATYLSLATFPVRPEEPPESDGRAGADPR